MVMESIKVLMDEHRLILRGMRVAQVMAKRFFDSGQVHREHLEKFLKFVTEYADRFHHKKEEDVLFEWMKERGFPSQQGPIGVMLHEHDIGRDYIASIEETLKLKDVKQKASIEVICAALIDFAAHLSSHIYKEDNILYPMAAQLAQPDSDAVLLARYASKVSLQEAESMRATYEGIVFDLERSYSEL